MAIKDNLKSKGALAGDYVEVPVEIPTITEPVPSITVTVDPKYIVYGFVVDEITTKPGNRYTNFTAAKSVHNSLHTAYLIDFDKNTITITAKNEANHSIANITGFTAYCVM